MTTKQTAADTVQRLAAVMDERKQMVLEALETCRAATAAANQYRAANAALKAQNEELAGALREVLLSRDVSLNGSAGADVAAYWEDRAEEAAAQDDPEQPRHTADYFRGRALDRARAALSRLNDKGEGL